MNLRLEAHAKSRTLLALKCQVLVAVLRDFSASPASSWVTMSTGLVALRAWRRRSRWVALSTASGFCSSPVLATM